MLHSNIAQMIGERKGLNIYLTCLCLLSISMLSHLLLKNTSRSV